MYNMYIFLQEAELVSGASNSEINKAARIQQWCCLAS